MFLFRVEKILMDSLSYTRNFVLSTYHTINYLDLQYNIWQSKKHPGFLGLGLGWIYNGTKENLKQESYGYGVISITFGYKITWFYTEIRGDIPLDLISNEKSKEAKIFPITLGLVYRMRPKNSIAYK